MNKVIPVILAAGQSKRMQSRLPKGLHRLAGKPILEYIIQTALAVSKDVSPIVVIGYQGDQFKKSFSKYNVRWVEQKEQLGTGHALLQALPLIQDNENVLVLAGDVPLISVDTLKQLINKTPASTMGMLTADLKHPAGYGRIKRDKYQHIQGIVEEKDATEEERLITEINPGIYLILGRYLKKWLANLSNDNAQREYYLTDIIKEAVKEKISIVTMMPAINEEILGINDRRELNHLERFYQKQLAEKWMREGVTIIDPARLDIRGECKIGKDVTIDVNVILEGEVIIGDGCVIGPNTILRDVILEAGVEVKAHSLIEGAAIGTNSKIGPFARLRPGAILKKSVHIGNFVEVKNSQIDEGTKINHLSYIGDSEIGKKVNVGAGTITCNYDGANKHKTIIGDEVHIGSDTQLAAPITIGAKATIGAGSTITKNVPPAQLTLTHRLEQRNIPDWERPLTEVFEKMEKNN